MTALRDTGLDVLGATGWGSHVCLFYEARADLVDVVVPFLAAGLLADELCVWMPSDPEAEHAVSVALRERVPDLDARMARGQLEFSSGEAFYRGGGTFDVDAVMARWQEIDDRVRDEGFAGLRASGDLGWARHEDRCRVREYEARLHEFVHGRPMFILCTYPLEDTLAVDVLDLARAHHVVMARRRGAWESVVTPEHARAVREIERLTERKHTAARLVMLRRRAREQAFEARVAAILEERSRFAREMHDSLLQGVTGIALHLRAVLPRLRPAGLEAAESVRRIVELAEATAREARRTVWEMRPLALSNATLPAALEQTARRIAAGLHVDVVVEGMERQLPGVVENVILRIAQESVANAVRHSGTASIRLTLAFDRDSVQFSVTDCGRGFDVHAAMRAYLGRWGLLGMRERADRIGAALVIDGQPGIGTTVTLRVPNVPHTIERALQAGVRRYALRNSIGTSREELTRRETEVLTLAARGLANRQIARAIGCTAESVKAHLRNVMDKLEVYDRTEVVVQAVRRGIIDVD
jgi:signal transduction histidine kinase/DNA-binding CsgD family transcriptional regulator